MNQTTNNTTLYDTDTYAWSLSQAALLRGEEFESVDWDNIIEEIESLGKSAQNEAESRLILIIQHLLKWRYQPNKRGRSWRITIGVQRRDLRRHLNKNPSLSARMAEFVNDVYDDAVYRASLETDLPRSTFPAQCPWTAAQIMDEEFWPEG